MAAYLGEHWAADVFEVGGDDEPLAFTLATIEPDVDSEGHSTDYSHSIIEGEFYGGTVAEARATAKLIAAAPDLLIELEHLVKLVESQFPNSPSYLLDGARAAIAQARGRVYVPDLDN